MNKLKEALSDPIWKSHEIGDKYQMDNKPDYWEIAYYPIVVFVQKNTTPPSL